MLYYNKNADIFIFISSCGGFVFPLERGYSSYFMQCQNCHPLLIITGRQMDPKRSEGDRDTVGRSSLWSLSALPTTGGRAAVCARSQPLSHPHTSWPGGGDLIPNGSHFRGLFPATWNGIIWWNPNPATIGHLISFVYVVGGWLDRGWRGLSHRIL